MSDKDDTNSIKDKGDFLKENSDSPNTGQVSEDNNISIKDSLEKADDLGSLSIVMAEASSKKILKDSNNESVEKKMDTSQDKTTKKSSKATDEGSGDCSSFSKEMTKEVSDFIAQQEKSLENIAESIKTSTPNVEADEKHTKNVTNTMSDDEIDEENLTLRWEDDDGNDISSDNHTESPDTKNDNGAIEDPSKLNREPKSPENKLDATETETEIKMPVVKEVTSTQNNSEMTAKENNAEAILEEKLLEDDDVETTDGFKIPATVELNEEDLLKDDVVEDSDAMDIDTFDKNIEEVPEIVEKNLETADNKIQEHSLEKDEPKSLVEAEKQVDSDKSNIGEQDEHLDNVDSVPQNINNENTGNNSNCNNNDNNQEENQMDEDNSINISLGGSPLHIKTNHGLHKPDVMLEIPTQELIDIDDVLDSPDVSKIDDDAVNDSIFDDNNVNNSKLDDVNDNSKKEDEVIDGMGEEIVEPLKEGISEIDEVNMEKDTSEAHVEPIVSKAVIAEAQPPTSSVQPQPSTSTASNQMIPDNSDEVPNVSDSLGLLAESHRVVDDDEDQDDDEDPDDDDDSDLDEDSNDQHSETERIREEQEKESEDNAEEREDIFNKCEEDFEYILNDVGTEEQTDDTDKIRTFKREVLSTEEIQTEEINQEEVNNAEVELTNVENEEVKTEHIKYEEVISEMVKSESVKSEKVNTEKVRSEELKKEDLKREIVTAKVEKTEALLPELKHAAAQDVKVKDETASSVESKVKIEKTDAEMSERSKKFAARKAILAKRFTEVPVSSPSNDDVIVQIEEIETVKLSDDEDEDVPPPLEDQVDVKDQPAPVETTEDQDKPAEEQQSKLESEKPSPKSSPSKLKDLTISSVQSSSILNFVELEESSSEDDLQETKKVSKLRLLLVSETTQHKSSATPLEEDTDVTSVNIPTGIEIMSTSAAGNTSEIVVKEGEVVISGVPKPPPHKPARLNTSEVTIKTASPSEQTLYIPEINEQGQTEAKSKPKLSLEIFSLDSDEEDTPPAPSELPEPEEAKKRTRRCINYMCDSGASVFLAADNATAAYYDASRKRRPMVCQRCAAAVRDRQQRLIEGIKDMTPLLQLDMTSISQDLVEILDSDSEDEDPLPQPDSKDVIGEEAAEFLEKHLADCLNKSWKMYNLDDRLKDTQDELGDEIEKLENASKEINDMLNECQRATDRLRTELYATFEQRIHEMPPILIYETPEFNYIGPEMDNAVPITISDSPNRLNAKRKMASDNDMPAKRPAIPLGYAPLEDPKQKAQDLKAVDLKSSLDDDKDISVVKLSAESAPADLPAMGELSRPPLRAGMSVFAMKNAFGPWFTGKIMEIMLKTNTSAYTSCRVKFDHKAKNNCKILPGRCIAYAEPADARLTIGTRLVALFKDSNNKKESFYSGIVAEVPNPVNSYRYLVFFDDGYAQYVSHPNTRLVCESSAFVWEEVHPNSREFVREYLMAYPERPMVRLHEGQFLKTEWDNKWWSSRVLKVDASLAQVVFTGDGRREWVYRGSTRLAPLYLELQAAERHRPRPMPRSKHARSDMPYVEYTRSDEQPSVNQERPAGQMTAQQQNEEKIRRQRAVARKSTALPPAPAPPAAAGTLDTVTSRVVYYTPKNAEKPFKLVPHKCSPKCKREKALSLKDLRTYNPLAKPLLSGWERQIVRYKGQREVMYRSPCGRRLRNMQELHRYLRMTESELPVDLFDFYHGTHCLAEFVLNKCLVGKKDLSHGKENVPVPCVNYYDDSLPEFCSYNTERTPTAGVPLNLDPEFLCGCDCTDDCQDKTKCACWKMTLEGARTIGMDDTKVGYEFKRLPEPLPSGIYECNSRCKCKETCLNRVAQHPLQLKLQVFKTLNRGWGIRALNDVPKGAFLCVYAGNLLTDATANLDGLNEGDEYLAELDYIEVVEQMKEGYEEDIPEADKKMIKKDTANAEGSGEESSSSEEDENASKTDKEDDDFRPGYIGLGVMEFNKRLRRRNKIKKEEMEALQKSKEDKEKDKETNPEDDCITISDDEEIREPSRFAAQPGMGGNDFISKYKSVRVLFGEDEACYIMDAKVQGNIGRYLNHSCSPNVFVQNVFVDTHDPRFPWVAFFALSHIKAGTELTWNYNYDVGSVPGKVLYCYCEAPNCRGRLL